MHIINSDNSGGFRYKSYSKTVIIITERNDTVRKYKVAISFVLVLAIVLPLFGCNTSQGATGPTNTENPVTIPSTVNTTAAPPEAPEPSYDFLYDRRIPDTEFTYSVQYLPENVENPNDLPVLKWVCLVDSCIQAYSEQAVRELNQTLADNAVPFRLQLVMVTTDKEYLAADFFSREPIQELLKNADLVYGFMKLEDLTTWMSPITEYVTGESQPSLANAVLHEKNWIGTTVKGEIYGIRTFPVQPWSDGWMIDAELLQKSGLRAQDIQKDYWEMDEVFEKLYEANGNKPFLYYLPSVMSSFGSKVLETYPHLLYDPMDTVYQTIGASFAIDHSSETPKVVNMLSTDRAKKIREAFQRYKEAGYVTNDPKARKMECISVIGNIVFTDEDGFVNIPVAPLNYKSLYGGHYSCGIVKTSQHKAHAVTLLNLIAEDKAFRDQLLFGKEGRDYQMAFLSMYGRIDDRVDFTMPTYEGMTKLESYRKIMDDVQICDYPIVFDYSDCSDKLANIWGMIKNLSHSITTISEDNYEQKLQEMADAGGDEIVAQLQRQLDEWITENPNWNP